MTTRAAAGDGAGDIDDGAAVIVYDDGPLEDYTKALPVHREYDMPATSSIVSSRVGDRGYMGTDHLDELVANGWEIASHTANHETIASFSVVEDLAADETTIATTSTRNGHHEGHPLEITDGDHSVVRDIVGFVDAPHAPTGRRIEVADPIGKRFDAGETEIRFTAEVFREALGGSKETLENMGYDVDTLLAPYDQYSGYSDLWVPVYYDGVANA